MFISCLYHVLYHVYIISYEDEQVVRKAYDLRGCDQDTTFLTYQGVYRLLYK
jgi:hypothetical protein